MSTWPQGQITPYGADVLTAGAIPNIWITSADGEQKFYIMGGAAPFAGVQDGIVCREHPKGLAPKFKHLDIQGAQQDGVTWQATVYDPATITLKLDVHARTPQMLSKIMNEWMGAWNPKKPCTMEYITPDGGYWYAKVRLLPDSWGDAFKLTPRLQGVWSMTHMCRIDDSFWRTIDVLDTWSPGFIAFSDDFTTPTKTGLGSNWLTTYTPGATGYEYVGTDGEVHWYDRRNTTQAVMNTYIARTTQTDDQVITVTIGTGWEGVVLQGEATTILGGRLDGNGNGVFCEIGWSIAELYCVTDNINYTLYKTTITPPPKPGETWQLVCGAIAGTPRSFSLMREGVPVFHFVEPRETSPIGGRYTGFGMTAVQGTFNEAAPAPVAFFGGGDNGTVDVESSSGYLELSNPGSEDGWPSFLMYGPGTWSIGNGPGSTDMISFVNLAAGQTIFLATLPRHQRVLSLSAGAVTTPSNNASLEAWVKQVYGDNQPLLVQAYENEYAVVPATGKLQTMVSGAYTNPIPGVATPDLATLSQIKVSVTGGTAASQIIGAVTPRRIHPA